MMKLFLTGGRGDIGFAIKESFLKQGFEVVAPNSQDLDLSNFDNITAFIDRQSAFDAVIHCAGINFPKLFKDISDDDFLKTMSVNTLSFYKIIHELVRQNKINQNGAVLAVSSIYGVISRKRRFSYAASKHSLTGMVQTLALELANSGVRTNVLAPGFVDTKLTRQNNDAKTIQGFERKIPLGRLARPEDIAKVAYFLCSDQNQYINGQVIVVDGGYSIGGFEE